MKSFTAGLATLFAFTGAVSAVCTQSYVVQKGDICNVIALSRGISASQIFILNPNACPNIFIGQRLCLFDSAYNCQPVVDVIQPGDSCFSIATAFKITLTELFSLNSNIDSVSCTNIFPGEVLCVAPRH
ncbi:carbohydrate-binding module family 50 protein [Sphaerobolus stellatus SS14]|uniref:Carbohydrate-binding module family 50 protein n=1 Tax=Sphaerobolus stellatus (strain SS14) TaxID=990650 RepID=A0A0C9UJM4_SPHS4|nr:carbohydrate-binding module family 50 protein [Sphaerobolus stellatus SS14]